MNKREDKIRLEEIEQFIIKVMNLSTHSSGTCFNHFGAESVNKVK